MYALAAIGLNVQFGYRAAELRSGRVRRGLCTYGLAMGVLTFGWPFWPSVLAGLVGAALLALVLGVTTLRLRADYLAIATVAAAEALRRLVRMVEMSPWTGGAEGCVVSPTPSGLRPRTEDHQNLRLGPLFFTGTNLWVMIVGWGWSRSPSGGVAGDAEPVRARC